MDAADPQKDGVYSWEDGHHGWNLNTHTLPYLRGLIRQACERYGVEPPYVTVHMKCSLSYSAPADMVISLQGIGTKPGRGGLNPATALHEAAHHVVYWMWGSRPQDHGPTFLGLYIELLEAFGILHSKAEAKEWGLRWRQVVRKARPRPRGGASGRRLRYRSHDPIE